MNIKLLIPALAFTIACKSAQPADHSSILQEKGKTVRLVLADPSDKPIAGTNVELGECESAPCSPVVHWTQKSRADGSVDIPQALIQDRTVVATPVNEPRPLNAARWRENEKAWTIKLLGRVSMVCSKYDIRSTLLVAEDSRSAQLEASDDLGLMQCYEGKGAFQICRGPQNPDEGFTAYLTRAGDNISARLTAETIAGRRELAQLDCLHVAAAEALPRDLKTWAIEYSAVGGIAGLNRHLRLTESGELDIAFQPGEYASHVRTHASPELVKRISDFLGVAQKQRQSSRKPIAPDALYVSLALVANESKYMLETPDDLVSLLDLTINSTLKKAFVGTWSESEWKLCKPAAQLTADQMDPPIERLVFQEDDHFSVTWRGGAEAPGRPGERFVWAPDYSGRYALQPDHNSIHMTFENGIRVPRDFSGDGSSRITGDKLILNNVWLGTYKAKQKPDICEMTFTRNSDGTHGRESGAGR